MDSLSLSAKLLSVLTLAQKSSKLISAATRLQDPKIDQIYYRLLAEKKRTAEWASQMRVLNSTNSSATIPSEEYDAVVVLLGNLDTCYRKAQEKFSAIEYPRKGPVDPTALKAKTKSLLNGYDDLKEFVDTLAAMNNAWKSSAPSLPTCAPRAYRHRSCVRLSSPMTMDEVSLAAKPSPASDATAQNIDEAVGVYEPTTTQPVHSIYQTTLDNLVTLSVRRRNSQLARSASRLKLWGAGLFKMAIPLDIVFESDKDSYQPLRNCILKSLVEILVWEGA